MFMCLHICICVYLYMPTHICVYTSSGKLFALKNSDTGLTGAYFFCHNLIQTVIKIDKQLIIYDKK